MTRGGRSSLENLNGSPTGRGREDADVCSGSGRQFPHSFLGGLRKLLAPSFRSLWSVHASLVLSSLPLSAFVTNLRSMHAAVHPRLHVSLGLAPASWWHPYLAALPRGQGRPHSLVPKLKNLHVRWVWHFQLHTGLSTTNCGQPGATLQVTGVWSSVTCLTLLGLHHMKTFCRACPAFGSPALSHMPSSLSDLTAGPGDLLVSAQGNVLITHSVHPACNPRLWGGGTQKEAAPPLEPCAWGSRSGSVTSVFPL